MSTKVKYREGDIFGVPLRRGGFSLGVVARAPRRKHVLLGYFFPCRYTDRPLVLPELRPSEAVRKYRFGDLSLLNGDWPIWGHVEGFARAEWPHPMFIRRDPLTMRAWLVFYADDDPGAELKNEPCNFDLEEAVTAASLGSGAVELQLEAYYSQ